MGVNLCFAPSFPENDLIDFALNFEWARDEIVCHIYPGKLSYDVSDDLKCPRESHLRALDISAQKIIDWWAEKQADLHLLRMERGIAVSLPKAQCVKNAETGKIERVIKQEQKFFQLPDTPENRRLTTPDGYKTSGGDVMLLVSALDDKRKNEKTDRKIIDLAGKVQSKMLLLGRAFAITEQYEELCHHAIQCGGDSASLLEQTRLAWRQVCEYMSYAQFSFVHCDGDATRRETDTMLRNAMIANFVKDCMGEINLQSAELTLECLHEMAWGRFEASEFGFNWSRLPSSKRKKIRTQFSIAVEDELKLFVKNSYYNNMSGYPGHFSDDQLPDIPCYKSAVFRVVQGHMEKRQGMHQKLGAIRGRL